jgi:hypothetical protein
MAQTAVQGKDVEINILKLGDYVPYACATSIDYKRTREVLETSTVDSAGESEFEYGFGGWGVTINGVTHIVPMGATGFTVFEMLDRMNTKTPVDVELVFADPLGNIKTLTGRALVVDVGISAGSEGFSEDNLELQGTGVITIDTTLIDPVEIETETMKIEYTASGGEETITDSDLVGKTLTQILHVHRDVNALEPIDVGTPTDKQVKFISGTGTMSFASELLEGEFILILYK